GRLQAQGYLDKRSSEVDARQANVFLTERGRDAIRSIEKAVRKTDRLAFKGLDKKERSTLLALLARIEANLTGGVGLDDDEEDEIETETDVPANIEEDAA